MPLLRRMSKATSFSKKQAFAEMSNGRNCLSLVHRCPNFQQQTAYSIRPDPLHSLRQQEFESSGWSLSLLALELQNQQRENLRRRSLRVTQRKLTSRRPAESALAGPWKTALSRPESMIKVAVTAQFESVGLSSGALRRLSRSSRRVPFANKP